MKSRFHEGFKQSRLCYQQIKSTSCINPYVGLYLIQTLYSWNEKVWQFKTSINFTVKTGYFWIVENKPNVLLDKVPS